MNAHRPVTIVMVEDDEGHARLSPGRALAIEMLRADFAAGRPFRLDSGAGDKVDPSRGALMTSELKPGENDPPQEDVR